MLLVIRWLGIIYLQLDLQGGILIGVKIEVYEVIEWHAFQFCAIIVIRNWDDQFIWRLVVIYGSPYEEKSLISLLN
jgi:hypothetical protein